MAGLLPNYKAPPKPKLSFSMAKDTPSFSGGAPGNAPKTAAEVTAYRNESGIAPTAQNMGSLAVQYRADETTAHEAGQQSVGDKRAQKVIDTRALDKNKRNQDRIRAEQAFKKRQAMESQQAQAARGLTPTGGASVQSTNRPGVRQSAKGLGSAQAPKSPYGLFK